MSLVWVMTAFGTRRAGGGCRQRRFALPPPAGALLRPCTGRHDHAQYAVAGMLQLGGGRGRRARWRYWGFRAGSNPSSLPSSPAASRSAVGRLGPPPRAERAGPCAEPCGPGGSPESLRNLRSELSRFGPLAVSVFGEDDQPVWTRPRARRRRLPGGSACRRPAEATEVTDATGVTNAAWATAGTGPGRDECLGPASLSGDPFLLLHHAHVAQTLRGAGLSPSGPPSPCRRLHVLSAPRRMVPIPLQALC